MSAQVPAAAVERHRVVVVNTERQRSLWPADRELPLGRQPVGGSGPEADRLARTGQHRRDLRPLSVRRPARIGDGRD